MTGPNTPYTALDANQVLKQSFDESADRLRVDAEVTAVVESVTVNVGDVSIKDGTVDSQKLKVNPDGSIDVNAVLDAAGGDNVAIGNTWKKYIDQPNATTTYIGASNPGSSTSSAAWQIKRITVSGTQTFIEFADGNLNFDNVWNNRAALTYN